MTDQYAHIIVDISHEKVDRPFLYKVPDALRDTLEIGMSVTVPFGSGNKERKGYVIAFLVTPDYDPDKIKEISGIVSEGVNVQSNMIRLAGWIRKNYGSTMIQALKTVLPVKQTVKSLSKRSIKLILPKIQAETLLTMCERKHQKAKVRLLQELLQYEELPYQLVTGKLSIAAATIKSLEKDGAITVLSENYYRNPIKLSKEKTSGKQLSTDQQAIVEGVIGDYEQGHPSTYLIHGITGSGKTEVYLSIVERIVVLGKQAIVLIPEIALTYQTVVRFYSRFGDRVSVMNSTLSPGEKYDQFERAKNGELDVIIGPRSALFTPFSNIGVIIIDEEHETSYKSETSPKYHARETAGEIARMHGASLVLGSATPSLESYYRIGNGEYKLFKLTERLTGGSLPAVYTIDLREELKQGNRSIFSGKLQELIEDRLQKGQQTMLFLNRRGYAGFISCRACGHVMKCPHCDVSLSEHRGGRLICHYCGYEEPNVKICPECGSKYISGFRAGTQQIEEKLKEMYPNIRTLRMDADTTKKKDSYEAILSAFSEGQADVLIGTQMIVKGHDFPNVTLVGILAADMSLSVGDYRASERTFQLLTQAAGRAGRGSEPGEVVIQTYQPEHYSIIYAARQDYEGFYEEEILYREMLRYPPVCHMMAVQIFAKREDNGCKLANELAELAKSFVDESLPISKRMLVIGPAPAGIGKINDIFRFVFYVKFENYDKLIEVKDALEKDVSSRMLRDEIVQMDFDPVSAF